MAGQTSVGCGKAEAAPGSGSPEWMVVIRVYGSIMYATKRWGTDDPEQSVPLEPQHIEGWMADCVRHGITTVLWRANCAGTLTYPSKFAPLTGEQVLPDSFRLGDKTIERNWPHEDWAFLGKQCRSFNTLEAAVTAAHQRGLKFYLDFSTFDTVGVMCAQEDWPTGGDRTFDPDLWLWSKDQKERLAGVPCYAEPQVRALRVGEIAEALEYGIDGVMLGFFSHNDSLSGDRPSWYGYNPVIVKEYKQRYGVDPLADALDTHGLFALHGEYFTEFVREAGKVVRAKGKKLLCTTRTDGIHGWNGKAAGSPMHGKMAACDLRGTACDLPLTAGFYLEWEKWARQDWVDGLVVYAPFEGGVADAQKMRSTAQKPVYLQRKYSGFKGKFAPPQSLEGFRREIGAVRNGALDGYVLHVLWIVKHHWMDPDWRDLLS